MSLRNFLEDSVREIKEDVHKIREDLAEHRLKAERRIVKLETAEANRKWWARMLIGATAVAVIGAIVEVARALAPLLLHS